MTDNNTTTTTTTSPTTNEASNTTTTTTTTSTSTPTPTPTPAPTTTTTITTTIPDTSSSSTKRPLDDAAEDDDDHDVIVFSEDEDEVDFKFNCNQVRNKINALLRSGEVKITEFQRMLGINSNSYQRFMKLKGPAGGIDNQTYRKAGMYFYKREKEGKKIKRRKVEKPAPTAATTTTATGTTTTSTTSTTDKTTTDDATALAGEADETVPIFDTCDEIRRKIGAYLRDSGSTQAAFLRSIGALFHPAVNVQTNQLNEFMKKKGPLEGAASRVYYGSYVFFEKRRLAEGKAKSKTREEMEAQWGAGGVPRERGGSRVWVANDNVPVIDKYGKIHVVPK